MGKLKEALQNLAKEYQTEIQRLIVQEKLVDKGDLKNSIKYKVSDDGFNIESDEKYAYILGSNGYLKSWRHVDLDDGVDKLADWARRKGMRPLMRNRKGRFRKITRHSWRQLGFVLARSISGKGKKRKSPNGSIERFGYRGSRIIQRVNQKLEGKVSGEIMEAYRLDLIQGMKQQFKFDNIKVE